MSKLNKELKVKYEKDFAAMTEFVNSFDPCGFIEGGAPADEYDGISQQLLSFAYNKKTRHEMREFILREIEHHYETPDFTAMNETYKRKFNNDLDELLNRIEQRFC